MCEEYHNVVKKARGFEKIVDLFRTSKQEYPAG
jgi:hypothetical protein